MAKIKQVKGTSSRIICGYGEINFDENGVSEEIEEEAAQGLVSRTAGRFVIVGESDVTHPNAAAKKTKKKSTKKKSTKKKSKKAEK